MSFPVKSSVYSFFRNFQGETNWWERTSSQKLCQIYEYSVDGAFDRPLLIIDWIRGIGGESLSRLDRELSEFPGHTIKELQVKLLMYMIIGCDSCAVEEIAEELSINLSVEGSQIDGLFLEHFNRVKSTEYRSVGAILGVNFESETEDDLSDGNLFTNIESKSACFKIQEPSLDAKKRFSTVLITTTLKKTDSKSESSKFEELVETRDIKSSQSPKVSGEFSKKMVTTVAKRVLKDFVLSTPPKTPKIITACSDPCTPGVMSRVKHLTL